MINLSQLEQFSSQIDNKVVGAEESSRYACTGVLGNLRYTGSVQSNQKLLRSPQLFVL